jgi:hypothetical protein
MPWRGFRTAVFALLLLAAAQTSVPLACWEGLARAQSSCCLQASTCPMHRSGTTHPGMRSCQGNGATLLVLNLDVLVLPAGQQNADVVAGRQQFRRASASLLRLSAAPPSPPPRTA